MLAIISVSSFKISINAYYKTPHDNNINLTAILMMLLSEEYASVYFIKENVR